MSACVVRARLVIDARALVLVRVGSGISMGSLQRISSWCWLSLVWSLAFSGLAFAAAPDGWPLAYAVEVSCPRGVYRTELVWCDIAPAGDPYPYLFPCYFGWADDEQVYVYGSALSSLELQWGGENISSLDVSGSVHGASVASSVRAGDVIYFDDLVGEEYLSWDVGFAWATSGFAFGFAFMFMLSVWWEFLRAFRELRWLGA